MPPTEPRDKARKLVELAVSNANKNEGRNAALAACKLIHQHKLLEPSAPAADVDNLVDRVHAVATDPKVQQAAAAAWDLFVSSRVRKT